MTPGPGATAQSAGGAEDSPSYSHAAAIAALGLTTTAGAAPCYIVVDGNDAVVFRDTQPPFDLSDPKSPERAALAARLAAAEALVAVERSSRRPQVSATAGWEYANPAPRYLPPRPDWNDTWSVGVGLAFSVFDGGRAAAAAARAEAGAAGTRCNRLTIAS